MRARLLWVLPVALLAAVVGGLWLLRLCEPEPLRYAVVRGDTLTRVGKKHGVSVEDLRSWNGLQGDLIEVDLVLLIWPRGGGETLAVTSSGRQLRRSADHDPPGDARAGLHMPSEQPCLAGPALDQLSAAADELQLLASRGLSQAQVEAAMNAFIPTLFRCVPEGGQPDGILELELTVACTGRVAQVEQADLGGLADELAACVAETRRYTPFPAHDMPGGFEFRYPLRFSW